ncbi:unnamed protein product [Symbiodinium pilosum]|uniref:Ubiquitin-like domain-containing protein n=1 Tax=Symbiodinium pilosum TaxID=2952 RepID=A0A812LQM9_SYMPI|nr:unnamed protein product [Symbiodinium pilosum]
MSQAKSLKQLKDDVAKGSKVPAWQQRLMFEDKVLDENLLSQLLLESRMPDGKGHLQLVKIPPIAGTHLGSAACLCTPAANEVCWGYNAAVKTTCPQCDHAIASKHISSTDGCRRNGDAYGFVRLTCESCGLTQKHGWDEKD